MPRTRWLSLLVLALLCAPLVPSSPLAFDARAAASDSDPVDIHLYLYMENGQGKLNTDPAMGKGDDTAPQIAAGATLSFALNQSLRADLLAESYRNDVGFHVHLYVNTNDVNGGTLKATVRDGSGPTGGTLLAETDEDIDVPPGYYTAPDNADHREADLYWDDVDMEEYLFNANRYLILELENTGTNDINVGIDTADTESSVITHTNPIRNIAITTMSYDLEDEVPDPAHLVVTSRFEPNLPAEWARAFVSGTATDAFGDYNIEQIDVKVTNAGGSKTYLDEQAQLDAADGDDGERAYSGITWDYNQDGGQQHDGAGTYPVTTTITDLQGNEFSLAKNLNLDTYGVFLFTENRNQKVMWGGSVVYNIAVRNSGDISDDFEVTPSDPPGDWEISPLSVNVTDVAPGSEKTASFTVTAPSSPGGSTKAIIIFTGESDGAPPSDPKEFELQTVTKVESQYEIALIFDGPGGEHLTTRSVDAVAGQWNNFTLNVTNLGQDTDSVNLSASNLPSDWTVEFEYDGDRDTRITVPDIPREDTGENFVNVTVWVRPAEGGDVETAEISLDGVSVGNSTETASATLEVTRSYGLSLRVGGSGDTEYLHLDPGQKLRLNMVLESQLEGEHTILLTVDDLPSGWSARYSEGGGTVSDIEIEDDAIVNLELEITVGNQATYISGGYAITAMARDRDEYGIYGQRPLTLNIQIDTEFQLTAVKNRATVEPGEGYTFVIDIDNQGNTNTNYLLSAPSVPSGWHVSFPDGSTLSVAAGASGTTHVRIIADDEARDGDEERIRIAATLPGAVGEGDVVREIALTVEIEEPFGARLGRALEDYWYVFVLLGIVVVVGVVNWYKSQELYDEEYDDEGANEPPADTGSAVPKGDDDWDDWG